MVDIPSDLDGAKALNLCRTGKGWQASLEVSAGSFRVRVGVTPDEAIRALFTVPSDLPPLPY